MTFLLFFMCRTEDFVILHGDHHSLSDTIGFLRRLVELYALASTDNSSFASRENLAAAAIFNWEVLKFQLWLLWTVEYMGFVDNFFVWVWTTLLMITSKINWMLSALITVTCLIIFLTTTKSIIPWIWITPSPCCSITSYSIEFLMT